MIEGEPDTENVVYIDEYQELKKRVWLRRLNDQRRVGRTAITEVFYLPDLTEPDDAS